MLNLICITNKPKKGTSKGAKHRPVFVISKTAARFLPFLLTLALLGDMLYGVSLIGGAGTRFGIFIRGFVLLTSLSILFFQKKWSKWSFCVLLFCATITLFGLLRWVQFLDSFEYFKVDFIWLLKFLFFPTILIALLEGVQKKWISTKLLELATLSFALLASVSIVIPKLFSVGHATYRSGVGSTGILSAQNDIGLGLGICLFFLVYKSNKLGFMLTSLLTIFAMLTISTRAATLACVFAPTVVCLVITLNWLKNLNVVFLWKKVLQMLFFITPLASALVGVLVWWIFVAQKTPWLLMKLQSVLQGNTNRSNLLQPAIETVSSWSLTEWFLGSGVSNLRHSVSELRQSDVFFRAVEVDWIEILAGLGFPVALIFSGFIAAGLFYMCWKWLMSGRIEFGVALFASCCFVGHGVVAGHAFANPIPSTALALVIAWAVASNTYTRVGGSCE